VQALTERQETILALIIHQYIDAAQPVGSRWLVDRYQLGVSPATVRNDMACLTESGFLRQPHTSAGRIPTEKGYRYFVRSLIGETELPANEKRLISHQFHQARGDVDEWGRLAASVLARHSRVASLVTTPHADRATFKHLELINTRGNQVLMVLVLLGGDVRQQLLSLSSTFEQNELSQTAQTLTNAAQNKNLQGVVALVEEFDGLAAEILLLAAGVMARVDGLSAGEVVRDGLANFLSEPEFADTSSARDALRLFEERSFLDEVLTEVLETTSVGAVQVVIGGEGYWKELEKCSIVLARYGSPGLATGALGVLGPTRMAYGRTISAVRYVAGLMSDLVIESFEGQGTGGMAQ
jgi:heat-inducible transcriptional repressor